MKFKPTEMLALGQRLRDAIDATLDSEAADDPVVVELIDAAATFFEPVVDLLAESVELRLREMVESN